MKNQSCKSCEDRERTNDIINAFFYGGYLGILVMSAAFLWFGCSPKTYIDLPETQCQLNGYVLTCGEQSTDLTPELPAQPISCTVSDTETGAIISCTDGTSVEIFDGDDYQIVCHNPHGCTCKPKKSEACND